jgi:hypothetical protein
MSFASLSLFVSAGCGSMGMVCDSVARVLADWQFSILPCLLFGSSHACANTVLLICMLLTFGLFSAITAHCRTGRESSAIVRRTLRGAHALSARLQTARRHFRRRDSAHGAVGMCGEHVTIHAFWC